MSISNFYFICNPRVLSDDKIHSGVSYQATPTTLVQRFFSLPFLSLSISFSFSLSLCLCLHSLSLDPVFPFSFLLSLSFSSSISYFLFPFPYSSLLISRSPDRFFVYLGIEKNSVLYERRRSAVIWVTGIFAWNFSIEESTGNSQSDEWNFHERKRCQYTNRKGIIIIDHMKIWSPR